MEAKEKKNKVSTNTQSLTTVTTFFLQAFGFLQDPAGNHDYLWKALTVGGGVYLFFLIERILKIVLQVRKVGKKNNAYLSQGTCKQCHVIFSAFYYMIIKKKKMNETSFN